MTDDTEEPTRDRAVSYDHALDRSHQPRKGDLEQDVSVSVTPNRLAQAVPHGGTTESDEDGNRNRVASRSRVIWALPYIIPFDFFRRRLPQEWTKWRDTVTDNFRIISHKDFRFWSRVGYMMIATVHRRDLSLRHLASMADRIVLVVVSSVVYQVFGVYHTALTLLLIVALALSTRDELSERGAAFQPQSVSA